MFGPKGGSLGEGDATSHARLQTQVLVIIWPDGPPSYDYY